MAGASRISSPCVRLCQIDPDSRLCLGCKRSLDEIATWSRLSEAERLAIMAELPQRRHLPPRSAQTPQPPE